MTEDLGNKHIFRVTYMWTGSEIHSKECWLDHRRKGWWLDGRGLGNKVWIDAEGEGED